MIGVKKVAPNRVDLDIRGSIDADEMRRGLTELLDASEGVQHGRMLYTFTEFEMPTLAAIGVEFGLLPKLFGLLGRFDKCALLSDTAWLRKAAEIEGKLFPGIEIRSFELGERDAAEAWLSE